MDVSPLPWLLLSQWPGLSRRSLSRLLQLAPGADALLQLPDDLCLQAGAKPEWLRARAQYLAGRDHGAEARAAAQVATLEAMGGTVISLVDARYPALLREIPDPPPLLFVAGNIELLAEPQLAVVGSRNASRGGLESARRFAADLSGRGLCITSGLAWGVDAASHHGALDQGGNTIAVLGTGLDVVYPRRNVALYKAVLERGLLVSEFAPGTPPRREQFPQRNRVISGLSLGVLVVEAAVRSGSLITARFALEQGREVFAIPGSIHNPLARGCHQLIREGACLVESSQDILDAWVGWLPPSLAALTTGPATLPGDGALAPPQPALLKHLDFDPIPLDELSQISSLGIDELLPELLSLELEGWVEQAGGCWARCR